MICTIVTPILTQLKTVRNEEGRSVFVIVYRCPNCNNEFSITHNGNFIGNKLIKHNYYWCPYCEDYAKGGVTISDKPS